MDNVEEAKPNPTPKIEYSDSLQSPDYPFNVSIDPQGCTDLLRAAGVNQDKLDTLTIKVAKRPSIRDSILGEPLAQYNTRTNTIELFIDVLREGRHNVWKKANSILENREKQPDQASGVVTSEFGVGPFKAKFIKDPNDNLFPEMSSGKRLSWYLSVAPTDRARETVNRLLEIKIAKDIEDTFAHEAKHVAHAQKRHPFERLGRLGATFLGYASTIALTEAITFAISNQFISPDSPIFSRIVMGSTVGAVIIGQEIHYSLMSPDEKNAREFAKVREALPRKPFIEFSPK